MMHDHLENVTISIVGEKLRQARCARGLSIEDIARDTKMHASVISDLENDLLLKKMSGIYVKGFLKRYAEYLGLDSAPLVDEFFSVHRASTGESAPVIPTGKKEPLRVNSDMAVLVVKIAFIIILTALFIWYVTFFGSMMLNKLTTIIPEKKEKPQKVATVPDAVPASSPIPEVIETPVSPLPVKKAAPLSKEIELTVEVQESCWMQIIAEGTIVFQGVLSKGDRETWHAKKEMSLWFGNAGGVTLFLNGVSYGNPGKRGQVVKGVTVTPGDIDLP